MNPQPVPGPKDFFHAYEKAIQPDSGANLGDYYAESFLFAGESGAQTVPLEVFKKIVPKMAADARARGVVATRLKGVSSQDLDARYSLVKVVWEIEVLADGAETRHLDTQSSYLTMRVPGSFRIIGQIDHKDLSKLMEAIPRPGGPG